MSQRALVRAWFARVWKDSPVILAVIISFSFGSAFLLAAFPWLWQFVIDEVRDTPDPVRLRELGVWMAVVGGSHALLYVILQGSRTVMNAHIEWRARRFVLRHLSTLDDAFYRRWRAGDLVTRLYDDAGDKISWFLCSGVFRAFEAALIVVVCGIGMLSIDWRLTLWAILPLPLLIFVMERLQRVLGRRYREVQEAISGINDELTNTFGGIRIIQAARLQDAASARFSEAADRQRIAEVSTAWPQLAVYQMYGSATQFAVVVLLLVGGLGVIEGTLSLGQYVTFEGFVLTMVFPMFDAGMFLSRYKQTGVALERLQELLDERSGDPTGGSQDLVDTSLGLRDVDVVAEDGVQLLHDVALDVPAGGLQAVVGEVGAGKTVLMQLFAGARQPTEGEVCVGGRNAADLDPSHMRDAVAYVPQDPIILSLTVEDNILLGRDVDAERLDQALQISRLAQDLPQLPDGLQTAVGERGVTLSGGQQQRVALARALVGAPRILLLDDATAALDADTEAAFWSQLEAVLPDVGAVVVTHRVATLRRADEVVVLEGGRVQQRGRHDDLIATEGPYRRLYGRYEARERVAAVHHDG